MEVVLSSQADNTLIRDNTWLVMNARGFETEEQAREFGHALRVAADVSSVATRYGLDSGVDAPTTGVSEGLRGAVKRSGGIALRDNIHGIDIFMDSPNTRFPLRNARGNVFANPSLFLEGIDSVFPFVDRLSSRVKYIVLLLN